MNALAMAESVIAQRPDLVSEYYMDLDLVAGVCAEVLAENPAATTADLLHWFSAAEAEADAQIAALNASRARVEAFESSSR